MPLSLTQLGLAMEGKSVWLEIHGKGFSGEHQIFVKPELRLNPFPVNTNIF